MATTHPFSTLAYLVIRETDIPPADAAGGFIEQGISSSVAIHHLFILEKVLFRVFSHATLHLVIASLVGSWLLLPFGD